MPNNNRSMKRKLEENFGKRQSQFQSVNPPNVGTSFGTIFYPNGGKKQMTTTGPNGVVTTTQYNPNGSVKNNSGGNPGYNPLANSLLGKSNKRGGYKRKLTRKRVRRR